MIDERRARWSRSLVVALAIALGSPFIGPLVGPLAERSAAAQDRRTEAAAKDALRRVQGDFRASAFDDAIGRLTSALHACGTVRCAATTRAALHRDLGVMQFRKGDRAASAASFAEALKIDPKIEPNPRFDGPDVHAQWEAAKEDAGLAASEQPTGDFVHTPVAEQVVRTPLPIYVEYRGDQRVVTVVVKYMPRGAREYKRVTLARMGSGWGGLVPCAEVTRGPLRYYVQGFDANDAPVALSGDPKRPFIVPIRPSLTAGSAPSLPGQAPPSGCTEAADCPPGMPGCGASETPSSTASEPSGEETHAETSRDFVRLWIGVSGSIDVVPLAAADDVCKLTPEASPKNDAGYYCTSPDGADFPTRQSSAQNDALIDGKAGTARGGPAVGNVRVMISLDYALSANALVGARIGYVAHTYPGDAAARDGHAFSAPLHLELRASYLFGDVPLARIGFAPYAFLGAGAAEFDAGTNVAAVQSGIPGQRTATAWRTGGPWFVAIGGGARYAFSPRAAFLGAMKLTGAFGGSGMFPAVSPELALQFGF